MAGMGSRLKKARLQKGLTQDQLAERIGAKSRHIISMYENGNRGAKRPDIEMLLKICKVLDISIDYLFLGK